MLATRVRSHAKALVTSSMKVSYRYRLSLGVLSGSATGAGIASHCAAASPGFIFRFLRVLPHTRRRSVDSHSANGHGVHLEYGEHEAMTTHLVPASSYSYRIYASSSGPR